MDDAAADPVASAAGEASEAAVAVFDLLGNDTRLSILLSLWEAYTPFEGDNAVTFSALRDRVGIRQGAQFNYHLDKLVGEFVQKTDAGYELLPAGHKIVRTVIGLAEELEAGGDPVAIDLPCPLCGAQSAIMYQDQRVYRICTECEGYAAMEESMPDGTLLRALATPGLQRGRDGRQRFEAVRTKIYHDYALRTAGICPECSGPVDIDVHVCDGHDPGEETTCAACGRRWNPAVRFVCQVCKHWNSTSVTEVSMRHPAVVGFCWEHGLEVGYDAGDTTRWLANQGVEAQADDVTAFMRGVDVAEELVSRDPVRVRVTIRYDGEELALTVAEDLRVVDTQRRAIDMS